MPIFAVSGLATKHDGWGITSAIMVKPAIDASASKEEAIGRMLLNLEGHYPAKDGWRHNVDVLEVALDWVANALAYEKSRGH
jgi:hypothetical protein